MAITQAICNSFKKELAQGLHDFTTGTGHIFKVALYTNLASLGADTTVYDPLNESVGAAYVAGGFDFTAAQNITPQLSGSVAFWSWSVNPVWSASTIVARGALIYNATSGNRAVAVLDFGADKSSNNGTFTLLLPQNLVGSSVLRIL